MTGSCKIWGDLGFAAQSRREAYVCSTVIGMAVDWLGGQFMGS